MLVARVDVAHLEAERFLHVRLATVVAAPADWEWHGLQVVQFGVPDLLADECAGVQQAGGDLGGLELGAVVARRHDLGHVSLAVEVEAPAVQLQRQVHAAVEVPARLDAPGVLPHAGRQRQLPPVRAAPAAHRAAVHAAGVPAARGDVVGLVAQFGRHERAHAPAHQKEVGSDRARHLFACGHHHRVRTEDCWHGCLALFIISKAFALMVFVDNAADMIPP